jgi:autotransporter-associated beta strand protein
MSDAGSATITANNLGFIFFDDTATADHANITVNPGGEMDFSPVFAGCGCTGGSATAANAFITNNGITGFYQGSSAGNATITTNAGGVTSFYSRSSGGTAAFITNAGGVVDFSGLGIANDESGNPPDPSITGTTAGSIAGAGTYFLGSKQLTVGSNNLSTTVSGTIEDGGASGGVGGSLVKVGTGTLTLTGANTYTGGTTIVSGALELGNDGTTGSIIGNVTNNSMLEFDHSNTITFPGVISGTGAVAQIGDGTTILTANNIYEGDTTITAGTLEAGGVNVFSANSHTIVESGGTLDLHGFNQTLSNGLMNAGTVQLGVPDPTPPGTTLTVAGGYDGADGALRLNTFLGGDNSPSDRLVIRGGAATGNTSVHVTNVGGPGALTTGNGILVVNAIGGATTAPGAFALAGEVRAGAFDYDLFRGVSPAAPTTGSCALISSFRRSPRNPRFLRSHLSRPTRRRIHCLPASIRSLGPNSQPMGWCSPWRGNWGFRFSARSTSGSATPTNRTVAPSSLRLRPRQSICRPGSRPFCRPRRGWRRPVRCLRPRSGDGFSARRSTTTIRRSPIRAPAAISAASRAASTSCVGP